ncbi:hypothetical protein [Sphingorhabdus sp.]|uniref:hypothetical protein n=1 Tax=Sphingorhabdus sp. TaxID=1902408 RepID=UPI002FDEDC5E
MSAEIVTLPTLANLCTADAVEVLERMLERARNGEIATVAIAALTVDNSAVFTYSQQMSGIGLLGACTLLQHDLTAALIREGNP